MCIRDRWLPVWTAIHGAALHSLWAVATQFRHQNTPSNRAVVWHSFRRRLVETVARAFKADTTVRKSAFWATWGQHHILASPSHPRQRYLTDVTLLAGVMPDWVT